MSNFIHHAFAVLLMIRLGVGSLLAGLSSLLHTSPLLSCLLSLFLIHSIYQ